MYVLTNWIRTYRSLILPASKIRVMPLLRFHFFLEKNLHAQRKFPFDIIRMVSLMVPSV